MINKLAAEDEEFKAEIKLLDEPHMEPFEIDINGSGGPKSSGKNIKRLQERSRE